MKNLVKCLFIAAVIALWTNVLWAALTVDPSALELVSLEKKPVSGVYKVKNPGEVTVKIRVKPENWGNDQYKEWLAIEPLEFTLKPQEEQEVTCKVAPPPEREGEMKCMVFFVADEIGRGASAVGLRFGVPVYVILSGTEKLDVTIEDIKVIYGSGTLRGTIAVDNKSNIHIRPYVTAEIRNEAGEFINKYSIVFGQPVQAEWKRGFIFEGPEKLAPGKYKVKAEVDYGRVFGIKGKAEKEVEFTVEPPKEE